MKKSIMITTIFLLIPTLLAGCGIPKKTTCGLWLTKQTPSLHLETMESPNRKNTKPHETGHTEVLCPKVGLRESLLERGREPGVTMLNNK